MSIQYSITQNPDFALITVQLEAGQKIYSEPGAMASMDDNQLRLMGKKGRAWMLKYQTIRSQIKLILDRL